MCDGAAGWSPEVFCGPHGRCVNSVCECDPGWSNDLTIFKTPNCWLPYPAIQVIDGTVGISCLLVFFFVLNEVRTARSYARAFLSLTAVSMLFAALYFLAHYLEGGTHGPAAIVLLNIAIRAASDGIALAVYQMLKSFWKMTGKGHDFKKYVIACQVVEFVSLTGASIAGIVLVNEPERFSIAMTIFLLIFSIHFAGLLLFIIVSTKRVIRTVEGAPTMAIESTPALDGGSPRGANAEERRKSFLSTAIGRGTGDNRRTSFMDSSFSGSARILDLRSQELVNKVRLYRRFGKLVGPVVVVAVFAVCLIEWILGAVPLMWTMYAVAVIHFPIIGFAQTRLAKKSRAIQNASGGSGGHLLQSSPKSPRLSLNVLA